jgi:hypothetical protein
MNPDIHRLLDEAFAGVEMTPDAQDLKEEIRANLVARVDELEASGVSPTDAARRAIEELGDVRELLDDPSTGSGTGNGPSTGSGTGNGPSAGSGTGNDPSTGSGTGNGPSTGSGTGTGAGAGAASARRTFDHAAMAARRVRPKPGFVVRTVLLSLLAAASLVVFALGLFGIVPLGIGGLVGVGLVFAASLGVVTGDALLQETTSNHPLPAPRAAAFGLATGGTLAAVALGATFATHLESVWLVVVASLLLVVSIALFAWLGATQTNRHKAWTREYVRNMPPDRFTTDPDAAARFGIYTAVIWLITFVVIAVLVFTVGWWWAPLAFVAGFATMMLVLARMLFGHKS